MDDFDKIKIVFLGKYEKIGEISFYKYLLSYSAKQIILIKDDNYKGILPHIELLNYYEKSLTLYRRNGSDNIFNMAKIFRRAAHKIYRLMINYNLSKIDDRFLTKVK